MKDITPAESSKPSAVKIPLLISIPAPNKRIGNDNRAGRKGMNPMTAIGAESAIHNAATTRCNMG